MTRSELKETIQADSRFWMEFSKKDHIKMFLTRDHFYLIRKYMKFLRKEEYYRALSQKGRVGAKLLELLYATRKNRLGNCLGFYIQPFSIGKGTVIFHHGSIIINGNASIGEYCRLHGNNCIGNNGSSPDSPQIGDNVEIGYGAVVIGDVKIANDVKIGAGAVVVKDCLVEGATLVGVPAKMI